MIPSLVYRLIVLPGQVYQLLVSALDNLLDQGHPLVQPVDDRHLGDQLRQESGDHDNKAGPGKGTSAMEVVTEDVVVEPCSLKANHKHKSWNTKVYIVT